MHTLILKHGNICVSKHPLSKNCFFGLCGEKTVNFHAKFLPLRRKSYWLSHTNFYFFLMPS